MPIDGASDMNLPLQSRSTPVKCLIYAMCASSYISRILPFCRHVRLSHVSEQNPRTQHDTAAANKVGYDFRGDIGDTLLACISVAF